MNQRIISRIISAVIFGFLLALSLHHQREKREQMGREEYLSHQAAQFDLLSEHPEPLAFESVVGVCLAVGLFGAYELAAYGISRILKGVAGGEEQHPPIS
jgi:hypothetical protein